MKKTLMQAARDNVTADFVHNVIDRKQIKNSIRNEIEWLTSPAIRHFMEAKIDYTR